MKDWKKQEQQRIKQNKEDLDKLRQKIDNRISLLQNGNVIDKILCRNMELKEKWARKYGYGSKYKEATKIEFNKVKGRIK